MRAVEMLNSILEERQHSAAKDGSGATNGGGQSEFMTQLVLFGMLNMTFFLF
jgi:hypothetical protein